MSPTLKKNIIKWAIILLLGATLFFAAKAAWEHRNRDPLVKNGLGTMLRGGINQQISITMMPLLSFLDDREAADGPVALLEAALIKQVPLYYYSEQLHRDAPEVEDALTREMLIRQEGRDEDTKNIAESELDYRDDAIHIGESDAVRIEESDAIRIEESDAVRIEESDAIRIEESDTIRIEESNAVRIEESDAIRIEESDTIRIEESRLDSLIDENNAYAANGRNGSNTGGRPQPENSLNAALPFTVPAYPAYTYDWSEGFTFDDLIANFYAIDSTTAIAEDKINLINLWERDLTIEKRSGQPQILIYHTHSQEAFADSIPGDRATTIVGAGDRLAAILREQYGFNVLHHTGEYDVESRDYAYSNSLPEIEKLLAAHPTIEVVIDLHRDEMSEGNRLVMDLQGRPTARFMFFNGISYTKQTGAIDYLENTNLDANLAFSFQEQVAANEYYPGLARKIYLRAYRYNMHLMPRYTLIELGAQNNTVAEIMNACDPLAHIIATVLNGKE